MTNGMIWTPSDWLNKFYSFCTAAIVSIIGKGSLRNEASHRNQSNKSKLALYKPLLHFYNHLKELYMSNKTEHFSYKGGCGIRGRTCIKAIKEKLVWATDKQLQFISNIMSVIPLRNYKNKAVLSLSNICMHCYVVLSTVF